MVAMVKMMMVPGTNQVWAKLGPGVAHQATDCGLSLGRRLVCRLVDTCSTSGTNARRRYQHDHQHCGGGGRRRRGRPLRRHRHHRHLRRQVIIIIFPIATIIIAIVIITISIIIISLQYRKCLSVHSPIIETDFNAAYDLRTDTHIQSITCTWFWHVHFMSLLREMNLTYQVHFTNPTHNIHLTGRMHFTNPVYTHEFEMWF